MGVSVQSSRPFRRGQTLSGRWGGVDSTVVE